MFPAIVSSFVDLNRNVTLVFVWKINKIKTLQPCLIGDIYPPEIVHFFTEEGSKYMDE